MLNEVITDANLTRAYDWLCHARRDTHYNNDVWHLRCHWSKIKPIIQANLRARAYYFSPGKHYQINGLSLGVWNAQDALVQKALSLVLTKHLAPLLSKDCYHLAGRGGPKACVMQIKNAIADYNFVCRSDVNSYYATIDHSVLMRRLQVYINDDIVLALLARMLARVDDVNAELYHVSVGISKGNPLSPLLGAVYLDTMDRELAHYCQPRTLRYFRFMDDWLILCYTKYQLRDIVKIMNTNLDLVKQTKHPFKTYIGRLTDHGIDFLGYRIGAKDAEGLEIAWQNWGNYQAKLI